MAKKPLTLEHWIAYRFGLVAARMGQAMAARHVAPHDLPMPAWRALAVIARYGPLSAGALGQRTSTDPYRVVRAIDLLVGRGLITREPDPSDRRRARLELTEDGRRLYARIERGAIANERFIRAGLTDAEVRQLESMLDRIDAQVQALASGLVEPDDADPPAPAEP